MEFPKKALCLRCGELKFGALTPCDQCSETPDSDLELALSLALTEDYFGAPTLAQFGRMIQQGQHPRLAEESLQLFAGQVQEYRDSQRPSILSIVLDTVPVLHFSQPLLRLANLEILLAVFGTIFATVSALNPSANFAGVAAIICCITGTLSVPAVAWIRRDWLGPFNLFLIGAYFCGVGIPMIYLAIDAFT